jgi:hypothetical protein
MIEKDDFLRSLIQKSPLDSPSDDFVDRVMANLLLAPETAPAKKPYFLYVKAAFPFAVLILVLVVVFSTSDLPFLNWLPGKEYYLNSLAPYIGSLFDGVKNAFASKYVSFGLLISVSAGLLFLIDRWFSRRHAV